MEIAFLLAEKITSLTLVILMGFALVKFKLLDAKQSYPLSVIGLYLISPCVIISAFQIDYSPNIINGLYLSFGMGILLNVILVFIGWLLKKILKLDAVEQASSIYSNSGNLIIPLVAALFGDERVIFSCGFVAVQTLFFWTHCRMLVSAGSAKLNLKTLLSNINILSILIGVTLFILQIKLPHLVVGTLRNVGSMIGPNAMLIAGMLIATIPLKTLFSSRRIYLTTFLRLIFVPLCILILIKLLPFTQWVENGDKIMMISFLAVISPAASTVTQMALLYNNNINKASGIYGITTMLCIITMPIMIAIYQLF